jgi:hypothetical protein
LGGVESSFEAQMISKIPRTRGRMVMGAQMSPIPNEPRTIVAVTPKAPKMFVIPLMSVRMVRAVILPGLALGGLWGYADTMKPPQKSVVS